MRLAPALFALPMLAAPPSFTLRQAIRAEWERQIPTLTPSERAELSLADRMSLELTLQRIGAPGAPSLLPPELEKPTAEIWEARAASAKTPRERFDALFFLNRLKSPRALSALKGLDAKDAANWPGHLHLEAQVASARLNGGEVGPGLQGFLDALQRAGKTDPVRAQAARLRLVQAGKEKELLPPVKATPASVLALMDAWNKAPWEKRAEAHARMFENPMLRGSDIIRDAFTYQTLGLSIPLGTDSNEPPPPPLEPRLFPTTRLIEGLGKPAPSSAWEAVKFAASRRSNANARMTRASAVAAIPLFEPTQALAFAETLIQDPDPNILATLLPTLRTLSSRKADSLRLKLLDLSDPIARAAAIDDMAEAPADLEALIKRLWSVEEYDGVQVLLQSLEKWKLTEARRRSLLTRFCEHPCWTARLDAFTQLSKLEPGAPWPKAPAPSAVDEAILKEAEALAAAGRPVRMCLTFEGGRSVCLRLDPRNAPMNVANLVLLARKGFFNGRLVPRVVPDFVVQMGSPCDTMDGGPGYTVRCEGSLDWYGPGSVGMALSGKDTGGSQFFITLNAAPHLTGRYTRVGEVEDLDRDLKILEELELGARLERVEVLEPATGGRGARQ